MRLDKTSWNLQQFEWDGLEENSFGKCEEISKSIIYLSEVILASQFIQEVFISRKIIFIIKT